MTTTRVMTSEVAIGVQNGIVVATDSEGKEREEVTLGRKVLAIKTSLRPPTLHGNTYHT